MTYDIQQGAIGAVLELTCYDDGIVVDLTTAVTTEIILRGPSGPRLVRTAAVPSPATSGRLRYVTVAGDLQYAGKNRVQGHIVFDDGSEFWTTPLEIDVGPNL